jgi:hypothetical protein
MIRQQISDMLRLQDKLNQVVNPDWMAAGYSWYRAIYMEAAEMLDGLGWKWWKADGHYTRGQMQLELVDIWHFAMSHILALHEGDFEAAATEIAAYFTKLEEDPDAFGEITGVETRKLIDLLAGSAAIQRQLNGPAFAQLMVRFDLTWDRLYEIYLGKNVLNLFRQANGYKEGTYRKMWNGEEDNVVLERYMKLFPEHGPEQLLSVLGAEYALTAPKVALQ